MLCAYMCTTIRRRPVGPRTGLDTKFRRGRTQGRSAMSCRRRNPASPGSVRRQPPVPRKPGYMSHPGVWGQGYCYCCRDVVFPAKAGIHVTPTLRDSRLTPAHGLNSCTNSRAYDTGEATWIPAFAGKTGGMPYRVPVRQLGGIRHQGGYVDSGFRRKDGRDDLPCAFTPHSGAYDTGDGT